MYVQHRRTKQERLLFRGDEANGGIPTIALGGQKGRGASLAAAPQKPYVYKQRKQDTLHDCEEERGRAGRNQDALCSLISDDAPQKINLLRSL